MSKVVMNKSNTNKRNASALNVNLVEMNKVNMSSVLRYLELLRYQLGALGLLGLLGLLAGLLMLLSAVMPAQQAVQHKKDEITWLNAQPQGAMQQTQAPKLDDEQALQQFYQQFPPVGEVSKVLAQIHQLAQEKGISLVVGEYKLAPDANNPRLMRYEIIFPVQGSYKNLRAFIASASEKFPTLGLAEVNIKRESVKDTAVQIKLSYALLLRRDL